MKAFVGHSFDEKDSQLVDKIKRFIETTGVACQTGEKAENKSVASKVKEKILNNDIFVGIFTCDKELTSSNSIFKLFKKGKKFYTTSNWVIQESGFAIGSDRELIFLKENGIYKFPELQGDLEVIYFNRESLEDTFVKLNEIIDSIRQKKITGVSREEQEVEEDLEKQEAEVQQEKTKEKIKEKKEEAFDKLANAIFIEEDYAEAQKIYDDELEKILSDDEKRYWKALVLRYSHKLGDTKAFEKLEKHAEENKNNPGVIWNLALRYKEMREYQKATEKFLNTKELYDKDKKEGREHILNCYEQAGLCLAFDNKYEDAIKILSEILYEDAFKEYKAKILSILAKIAKIAKDTEKFFIYTEGSLNIDPSNTKLRFDLAYRHSEKGNKNLSLLHYKKLTETIKSPIGLNNLGVEYKRLKILTKSIESYFKSATYKETIAMANLAQSYLNEGFIENAGNQIKRANDLSKEGVEVHGNIGFAKERLDKILEDDETKENEILIEAEKEREFRVKYSEAYYCDTNINKEQFEGIWQTPWGNLKIVFDESKNLFKVDEEQELEVEAGEALIRKKLEPGKEHFKNRFIKIEGDVEKLSGRYKIEVKDVIEYKYIRPDIKVIYEADGYMVINKNYSSIDVMEKGKEEKLEINSWKKK